MTILETRPDFVTFSPKTKQNKNTQSPKQPDELTVIPPGPGSAPGGGVGGGGGGRGRRVGGGGEERWAGGVSRGR